MNTTTNELTICSSSKHYDTARAAAEHLTQRGITVNTPRFDFNEQTVTVDAKRKVELTREFLTKIRRSRCIYIIAVDGYTGCSVSIEAGFAAALHLPIFISEPPREAAITAITSATIATDDAPDFLAAFLGVHP